MIERDAAPSAELEDVAALVQQADASLLDLVDNLLDKGVYVDGEVVLGLAGVDLIYLRLSLLFCAADRVLPGPGPTRARQRPHGA